MTPMVIVSIVYVVTWLILVGVFFFIAQWGYIGPPENNAKWPIILFEAGFCSGALATSALGAIAWVLWRLFG